MKTLKQFLVSCTGFAVLATVFIQLNTQPVYAPPPCQILAPPNCGVCFCLSLDDIVLAHGCPESQCAL